MEARQKVVVVGDDVGLLEVLVRHLRRAGFETEAVVRGSEVIERVAKDLPASVLLDYRLPDATGEQVLRSLARERRKVPFIVISGQDDEQIAVAMKKLGAKEYLKKDATFVDRLAREVRLVIEHLATEKRLAYAEEALRESEAARSAMLRVLSDTMLQIRKDGTCVACVPGASDGWPFGADVLLGRKVTDVLPPDVAADQMAQVERALLTGETQIARYRIGTSGVAREYEARFAASGPEDVVAIVRDVTEQKQAEDLLREKLQCEELNELKTSILSTVSHELRTPLAIIKGYSTMLVDYDERLGEEEKRDYLCTIDRATDRLTDLVGHLLDMSRLDAGLLRLERVPTSVGPVLEMAVAEATVRAPEHRLVLKGEVPDIVLDIDGVRVRQVVDNLIDNATKYSETGSTVTVAAEVGENDLTVWVADEGIGILAENLPKVFDRMYRIKQKLARNPSGLGLGLALCKALVEAHGGKVWAESQVGLGSTFYFTLPLR